MSEFQIEMMWRCKACSTTVLGRYLECSKCGKFKGNDVEYFMPEDIQNAPKVEEQDLLKIAKGGANWNCIYCSSDQRKDNGECARCGAAEHLSDLPKVPSSFDEKSPSSPVSVPANEPETTNHVAENAVSEDKSKTKFNKKIIGFVGLGILLLSGITYALVPHPKKATISSVNWKAISHLEKNSIYTHEGFDPHSGNFDLIPMGNRVHHYDQVFDHYEKVSYLVDVPDGSYIEHFSVKEPCGEDCVTVPRVCNKVPRTCQTVPRTCNRVPRTCTTIPQNCTTTSRNCTSNKNGFATCTGGDRVCTGGGQSCTGGTETCTGGNEICSGGQETCTGGNRNCTTKYCNVQKTKEIQKFRKETKYRDEPRYRSEPRYAMWYSWKNWEWHKSRDLVEEGNTLNDFHYPSEDKLLNSSNGEKERISSKEENFSIKFFDKEKYYTFEPKSLNEFTSFQMNKIYVINVNTLGMITSVEKKL